MKFFGYLEGLGMAALKRSVMKISYWLDYDVVCKTVLAGETGQKCVMMLEPDKPSNYFSLG